MSESYDDIYTLVNRALANCFGPWHQWTQKDTYMTLVDKLMGTEFYSRNWSEVNDTRVDALEKPFVKTAEYDRLKMFAGPHGHALWKVMQHTGKKNGTGNKKA